MKYNITINQPMAINLGITINQCAVLDLLCVAPTWAETEIVDGKVFYWVSRSKISEELEAFNIKKDTAYRHLKTLSEKSIIIYKKIGKKDCIKLTDLGKSYYIGNKSEKEQNSEINPRKLGNKSEKNSEINPTYNNTKIYNNTNILSKELFEKIFSEKKIKLYFDKVNLNKCDKQIIKEIGIKKVAHEYSEYVLKNKNMSARLNKWLIAYSEHALSDIEYGSNNKQSKTEIGSIQWEIDKIGGLDYVEVELYEN